MLTDFNLYKTFLVIALSILSISMYFGVQNAFAFESLIFTGSINAIGETHDHEFNLYGTDNNTVLVVRLVCGNTNNPSNILDPVLTVVGPSLSKFDDDSFTACNNYFSSYVTFSNGEVVDGKWIATAAGYQGLGDEIGPYTLTVELHGSGCIKEVISDELNACNVETFLKNPHNIFMTEDKARIIAYGINTYWPDWKEKLPDCPCKRNAVEASSEWTREWPGINLLFPIYHPDASYGYRSNSGTITNEVTHGQQCTYDEYGDLIAILNSKSSGTPDFWHSSKFNSNHVAIDVDTFEDLSLNEYHQTWTPNGIGRDCPQTDIEINKLDDLTNSYNIKSDVIKEVRSHLSDSNLKNDISVCGKLNAFINQIKTDKTLSSEQKSQLMQAANNIKTNVNCSK